MTVATVRYTDAAAGPHTATLDDEARWTCTDPAMEESLNVHAGIADRSPARGDWLRHHAGRMADLLGGTVEFAPDDEDDDPRIRY